MCPVSPCTEASSAIFPWCLLRLLLGELRACSPQFTYHDAIDECLGCLLSSIINKIIISTCGAWSFPGMTYMDMELLGYEINSVLL